MTTNAGPTDEELLSLAISARERAYAPYSKFKVGAALALSTGEVVTGCNVENISFGLTMCAERVAVGLAIQKERSGWASLVLAAEGSEPIVPCGACRQVLAEFSPNLRIVSSNMRGSTATFDLRTLLPLPLQGILK